MTFKIKKLKKADSRDDFYHNGYIVNFLIFLSLTYISSKLPTQFLLPFYFFLIINFVNRFNIFNS